MSEVFGRGNIGAPVIFSTNVSKIGLLSAFFTAKYCPKFYPPPLNLEAQMHPRCCDLWPRTIITSSGIAISHYHLAIINPSEQLTKQAPGYIITSLAECPCR